MGKGIITSNEDEGLYLIDYIYNTAAIDTVIALLNEQIRIIEIWDIPALESNITAQEAKIEEINNSINAAIVAEDKALIVSLTAQRNEEFKIIERFESQIAAKKAEALAVNQKIADIEANIKTSENVSAWCADYNIDLAIGLEVGVMELPGEGPGVSKAVIIRPGGEAGDENAFVDNDGMMTQSIGMTAAQLYYTEAIMPSWQRWHPIYRLGTMGVVDKETDKCTVFMDNNISSYQGLDTIPAGNSTLIDVPIEYMGFNADAFESGDRVVVRVDPASAATIASHGTYTGTVIGFEKEPKVAGYEVRIVITKTSAGKVRIGGISLDFFGEVPSGYIFAFASENQANALLPFSREGEWEPETDSLPQWIKGVVNPSWFRLEDTPDIGQELRWVRLKAFWANSENTPIDFKIETKAIDSDDWVTFRDVTAWRTTNVFRVKDEEFTVGSGQPLYRVRFTIKSILSGGAAEWRMFMTDNKGATIIGTAGGYYIAGVGEEAFLSFSVLQEGVTIIPESYTIEPQGAPLFRSYPTSWDVHATLVGVAGIQEEDWVFISSGSHDSFDPATFPYTEL